MEEKRIYCPDCHQNIKSSDFNTLCYECKENKTHCDKMCNKCKKKEFDLYVSYMRARKSGFYDD